MTTLYEILSGAMLALTVMAHAYYIPYLLRKGWLDGENATVKRRKVCDTCFRDLGKLQKAMKNLETNVNES